MNYTGVDLRTIPEDESLDGPDPKQHELGGQVLV